MAEAGREEEKWLRQGERKRSGRGWERGREVAEAGKEKEEAAEAGREEEEVAEPGERGRGSS